VIFGLPHSLTLDEKALEKRYLQLSREVHPDHNRADHHDDCVAVLHRAAELNDAWRTLHDRWERARFVLETAHPGVMDLTKTLEPCFLMEAMDEAEAVADATPASAPELERRLQVQVDRCWQRICEAHARADFRGAATALHESRYHRKALQDLEARL